MKNHLKPFEKPIFVTRPLLPDLDMVYKELQDIWGSRWVTNGGLKAFKSGQLTKHYELEEALRNYLKVPALSVFNNGTIALMVGIHHFIEQGEVITTPFTFPATPHSLIWNHLTPVFCDIDETTLTIDPTKIESLITEQTTGILGVHVFGMPCDVAEIDQIAKKNNLRVIYDAAHAFGTEINGVPIGTFGDITMFSFHATKLFNTIEGGALTYNTPSLKDVIELEKDFGIQSEDEVILPGINGKLNEIQAAIGLLNLQIIEGERKKRKAILETYTNHLSGLEEIRVFKIPDHIKHSLQYFAIMINEDLGLSRDDIHHKLKQYNIYTRKYFYPLCSDYKCYKDLPSSNPENLPVAYRISREVMCLPFYGELNLSDVEKICTILREIIHASH